MIFNHIIINFILKNKKENTNIFSKKLLTKNKCSYIIISQSKQTFFTKIGGNYNETTNTYSKVETKYKEEYVYLGDTLWSIAQNELENNKYFEGKDIRYVIEELKKVNNLSNSNLTEGDKIRIPNY